MNDPTIKIPIDQAGHHYNTSFCIEFEAIYDVPFGIIRTIKKEFNDPSVFNQQIMDYDNYCLRVALYDRMYYNPVLIAMIDKDREKADSILQEMMKTPSVYAKVLNESPRTSMANFIRSVISLKESNPNMIDYIVICKNRTQVKKIKADFPKIHTSCEGLDFDIRPYDLIILERYENIIQYSHKKPIIGKYVWIPDFTYNMDSEYTDSPDRTISTLIMDVNKISTYKPYSNFTKPLG